jgi:hypothetical protein
MTLAFRSSSRCDRLNLDQVIFNTVYGAGSTCEYKLAFAHSRNAG